MWLALAVAPRRPSLKPDSNGNFAFQIRQSRLFPTFCFGECRDRKSFEGKAFRRKANHDERKNAPRTSGEAHNQTPARGVTWSSSLALGLFSWNKFGPLASPLKSSPFSHRPIGKSYLPAVYQSGSKESITCQPIGKRRLATPGYQ